MDKYYSFFGDEQLLKILIQKEKYSLNERQDAERKFIEQVEENLFQQLLQQTMNQSFDEIKEKSIKDIENLLITKKE
ncbi:hypothetical protein ABK040_012332 [Willaertia magna]